MHVQTTCDLSNHFLMAMPGHPAPNFDNTVVLVADHTNEGALGLVLNRPMELNLSALFERIDLELTGPLADQTVLDGGPDHSDRGFVVHRPDGDWSSTVRVGDSMALTSSKDILEALAQGSGPSQLLMTLGCARWGPGELEDQLAANAWLSVQADADIVFDAPADQKLSNAYSLLGVDPARLSGAAGHA